VRCFQRIDGIAPGNRAPPAVRGEQTLAEGNLAAPLQGGSVRTITTPPYDADWSSGSGGGVDTSGGGESNKADGSFGVGVRVLSGGSAWGAAGVAP
jgi:hypothetical protein